MSKIMHMDKNYSSGTSYAAGEGIDITSDIISVDDTIARNESIANEWMPDRYFPYEPEELCQSENQLWRCLTTNSVRPMEGSGWVKTTLADEINRSRYLYSENAYEFISQAVKTVTTKVRGDAVSCVINFTPSSNGSIGLILVKGLPQSEMVNRCYFPVFNYNSGKPINGGIWFANGTITYYGDTYTAECVSLIQYNK